MTAALQGIALSIIGHGVTPGFASGAGQRDSTLTDRFGPWLAHPQESVTEDVARGFYDSATVVLDANVLLDLYRFTQDGREQVFSVLELFGRKRLWLPHQIGLEFSRNRAKAVQGRISALHLASKALPVKFDAAAKLVREMRDSVADLMREMAQDEAAADSVVEAIPNDVLHVTLQEWQTLLAGKLKSLRAAEAVTPRAVQSEDPLVPRIADLYGSSIGEPFPEATLRDLVDRASNYRYPNMIPPGFADTEKETNLLAAGDYIVWEQILRYADSLPSPRRLIFVSGDTKGDWYERDGNGKPIRPWPALHDEMKNRTGAEILILRPREFLRGAQDFLGARLENETYEEVDRIVRANEDRESASAGDLLGSPGTKAIDFSRPNSGQARRLENRLRRIVDEQLRLQSQIDDLQVEVAPEDLADPRSFSNTIITRSRMLNKQATEVAQQIKDISEQ